MERDGYIHDSDNINGPESGIIMPTVYGIVKPLEIPDIRILEARISGRNKSTVEEMENPDSICEDNYTVAQVRRIIEVKLMQAGHDWRAA